MLERERIIMGKRIIITVCVIEIMIMGLSGCAVIKYDLKDVPVARNDSTRQGMKVAVAPFQDIRPAEEKSPTASSMNKHEISDRTIKDGDVAKGVCEALVTHFNYAKLFGTVESVDRTASLPTADALAKMKSLGYDALFTGKIKHFYGAGYATDFDVIATIMAFIIPVSAVVTIPIILNEENQNEGYVEIIDIQLTHTTSGNILWSGSFSKKMEMKYYDVIPVQAASETLREVAKEVVQQIEATKINNI